MYSAPIPPTPPPNTTAARELLLWLSSAAACTPARVTGFNPSAIATCVAVAVVGAGAHAAEEGAFALLGCASPDLSLAACARQLLPTALPLRWTPGLNTPQLPLLPPPLLLLLLLLLVLLILPTRTATGGAGGGAAVAPFGVTTDPVEAPIPPSLPFPSEPGGAEYACPRVSWRPTPALPPNPMMPLMPAEGEAAAAPLSPRPATACCREDEFAPPGEGKSERALMTTDSAPAVAAFALSQVSTVSSTLA